MNNRKFERAARFNRYKAIFFTLLFHVALIGSFGLYGEDAYKEYLPDTVKEWIGMEEETSQETDTPRP